MPALFAYLIAVGLLLGGGYGALSWLAAAEPIKVVAKAKSKPPSPPHDEANAEPASSSASPPEAVRSEENALAIDNSDHAAAASSDQPPSPCRFCQATSRRPRPPLRPQSQDRRSGGIFGKPATVPKSARWR
jgi:hypothetical protein